MSLKLCNTLILIYKRYAYTNSLPDTTKNRLETLTKPAKCNFWA